MENSPRGRGNNVKIGGMWESGIHSFDANELCQRMNERSKWTISYKYN